MKEYTVYEWEVDKYAGEWVKSEYICNNIQ